MDFLADQASLAVATRMRRLSDQISQQVRAVYQATGVDFDPRHFSVVRYLASHNTSTVTEMAAALGLTHPAISQIVKSLIEEGWLNFNTPTEDERCRTLSFSPKGKQQVAELEPIWRELKLGLDELLNETKYPVIEVLASLEQALQRRSISSRVLPNLSDQPAVEGLEITEWDPRYAAAFEDLNRSWIEKYFELEKNDLQILQDPEKIILKPGGHVFFAKLGGAVVGTCALFKKDRTAFELARMAVAEQVRRRGIGRALTYAAIKKARAEGAKKVFLESFKPTLNAGIELYRSCGFKESMPKGYKFSYKYRANIYMELEL